MFDIKGLFRGVALGAVERFDRLIADTEAYLEQLRKARAAWLRAADDMEAHSEAVNASAGAFALRPQHEPMCFETYCDCPKSHPWSKGKASKK
jgi:hypothetical protein